MITNRGALRVLTDEELANWIVGKSWDIAKGVWECFADDRGIEYDKDAAVACVVEWLGQEADE